MDVIDKSLLEVLQENSRMSFAEIGRKIKLSPSAVRERIQRFEDYGIIRKYSVVLDNSKLGFGLEAFILLKVFPGQLKNVIEKITDFPEVTEAHRVTGAHNLHLKVLLKDQLALQKLLDKLMVFGETNTSLILSKI